MKFQIGDRVKCIYSEDKTFQEVGTIVCYNDCNLYGVKYDGFSGGHSLGGELKGKDSWCGWWQEESEIALYTETEEGEKMKFSIGDRVVVCSSNYPWLNGRVGKIICFDGDCLYGVEFYKEDASLHSCGGRGHDNRCFWLDDDYLKKNQKGKSETNRYCRRQLWSNGEIYLRWEGDERSFCSKE